MTNTELIARKHALALMGRLVIKQLVIVIVDRAGRDWNAMKGHVLKINMEKIVRINVNVWTKTQNFAILMTVAVFVKLDGAAQRVIVHVLS